MVRPVQNNQKTRKEGDYEVQQPKRKCVLHINMLKQFHEQETNVGAALLAEADEYEDNTDYPEVLILGRQEKEKDTKIG